MDIGFARQDIALAGARLVEEVALIPIGLAPKSVRVLALDGIGNLADLLATKYCGSFKQAALSFCDSHLCFLKMGAAAPWLVKRL